MATLTRRRAPSTVVAAAVIGYVQAGLAILVSLIAVDLATTVSTVSTGALVLAVGAVALSALGIVLTYLAHHGSATARNVVVFLTIVGIVYALFTWGPGSVASIVLGLVVIGLFCWNADAKQYFQGS